MPSITPYPAPHEIFPELSERDERGHEVPLDADPTPVRVALAGLAVTIDPSPGPAALLRGLTAPPGAPGLPLLLYLALQRARVWRRAVVVASPSEHVPLDMSFESCYGRRGEFLDLTMHRLFAALDPADRARVVARFPAEARASVALRARGFADNAWCRAVREDRLGRAQYVAALANTHQYVRWTPRLLARALAAADDEALRDHFFHHLGGERGHERLIESDLRYLGVDVEFVVGAMAPHPATLAFMALQESMVGFHRDVGRFLAAPLVAEGLAAAIEPEFLVRLAGNIRRWGYDEPARALRFLVSHARVDGGEDGHFARTTAALARAIRDDAAQRNLLAALHLAADAFTRSYDAYADEFDLSLPT